MKRFALFVLFLTLLGKLGAASPVDQTELAKRWLVYGNGLAGQNRLEEAVKAYGQGLIADARNAALYDARGLAQWRLGRKEQALADLRTSLALDPRQTALAAWMQKAAPASGAGTATPGAAAGRTGTAAASAPLVAAAMPVSATATPSQAEEDREERLSSAEAALEGRDLEQALSLFKEGAAEAPNQAVWLRGEAETLYAQGHFEEARAALDQALSLTPDDPELKRMHDRFYPSNLDTEHAGGSPWGAMLRSMVLPGWGQFYNGQSTKGKLVCAVTLGLLAATAVTYIETDSAIAHYRSLGPSSSQSDFDSSYNTAYDYAVANDILGVCFYSAYAWNVFDAATHAVPPPAPAQSAIPRKPQLTLLAWQF